MKLKLIQQILNMARYMFYGLLIQVFLSSFLTPKTTHGQKASINEVTINLNAKGLSLGEIFKKIEQKTEFEFNYFKSNQIPFKEGMSKTNKHYRNTKLRVVLEDLSSAYQLHFKRVNNQIAVRRSKNKYNGVEEVLTENAAQFLVSGKVTSSEDNEALPGVNVLIKGSTRGTTTDIDGNYNLMVSQGETLQFSFIGYEPEEIEVGNQTTIDITLQIDSDQLEEVVVIGYGAVNKSDLTGSVASIESDEAFAAPVSNLDQALQGRASGVQVTSTNGAPGSGATIRIRGGNSITAGNEPLYVVDGFIGGGNLNTINPNDIKSIEILKDASSTAIYGSRGANGVILITTKRGNQGGVNVNLKSSVGVQSLPGKVDVQNAREFAEFLNKQEGVTPFPDLDNLPGGDTDWQEVITRDAIISDHQLSVTGGSDKVQYYVSAGLLSQEGIVEGSDFNRYTLRTNVDNQLTKGLKMGTNFALSRAVINNPLGTNLTGIIRADPLRPVFNDDGSYSTENFGFSNTGGNILANADLNLSETVTDRALLNTYLEAKIKNKITLKSTIGGDFSFLNRNRFTPASNPGSIIANRLGVAEVFQQNTFEWFKRKHD